MYYVYIYIYICIMCIYIYICIMCRYIYIYIIQNQEIYIVYFTKSNNNYTYIVCILWHIIETLPVSDVPINHQLCRLPLRQGTVKLVQWFRASKRFSNNSDTVARPNLVWRIFMKLYHVIITTRKIVFGDIYI